MSTWFAGRHAVVIGAGIGGLSAAAALAGHFSKVVVVERDKLPPGAAARPGVPQGKHPHGLLAGGMAALSKLFPGLASSLTQAGALVSDAGADALIEVAGLQPFPRRHLDVHTFLMSRPLIEAVLRNRLAEHENVMLRDSTRVMEIVARPSGDVAGVRVESREGEQEVLAADLVVDASGRGVPTLDFLKAAGRPVPQESVVGVDLTYGTATYSFPPGAAPGFKVALTLAKAPERSRCGFMMMREGGFWYVLFAGRGEDRPPVDEDAFLAFAKGLDTPTIYDALRKGRRHGEILRFGFQESRWRRFERLDSLPAGLLPIGDAICRLNPVYGQGMAVAALEALQLRDLLDAQGSDSGSLATLGPRFLAGAVPLIETAWNMAELADLVYPETRGEKPADFQKALEMQVVLNRLAIQDADVQKLMVEVRHLLKPGTALHDPEIQRKAEALREQAPS